MPLSREERLAKQLSALQAKLHSASTDQQLCLLLEAVGVEYALECERRSWSDKPSRRQHDRDLQSRRAACQHNPSATLARIMNLACVTPTDSTSAPRALA